ncbi:MAG: hypothetical protein Q9169_004633 [Polycauliona sp. 2 TL-2023]
MVLGKHIPPIMFGEDSNGRKISLLNSNCGPSAMAPRATTKAPKRPPLTSTTFSTSTAPTIPPPLRLRAADKYYQHRYRASRSPEGSSSTPPLVRHSSSSSPSESTTTSPMTPEYSSDPLDSQDKSAPYFAQTNPRPNGQLYPSMQAPNPFATSYLPHQPNIAETAVMSNGVGAFNQQALLNLPPPLSYPIPEPSMATSTSIGPPTTYHPSTSPTSTTTTKFSPTKAKSSSQSASTQTKNSNSPTAMSGPPNKKFPCPHATRFSCPDTFTTSGHAARHGKKHTGEKSVVCPTCNKAFTRKDNMKQHERTHKNTTPRKPGENATLSPIQSSHAHPSRPARDGRSRSPSMAASSPSAETEGSGIDFAAAPQMHHAEPGDTSRNGNRRPRTSNRVSSGSRRSEEDGEGESPGLDALAAAAGMELK